MKRLSGAKSTFLSLEMCKFPVMVMSVERASHSEGQRFVWQGFESGRRVTLLQINSKYLKFCVTQLSHSPMVLSFK